MTQKKNWFLRKNDGSEYGPVSLDDLLRWSAQCRLIAGNAVSTDREEWTPVEEMSELGMDWMAHRTDGKEYGPFALEAVKELFDHDVLPADAILVNRRTEEKKSLADVINGDVADREVSDEVPPAVPSETEAHDEADDSGKDIPSVTDNELEISFDKPTVPKVKKEPRGARRRVRSEQRELPGTLPGLIPDGGDSGLSVNEDNTDEGRADVDFADDTIGEEMPKENYNRETELLQQQIEALQQELSEKREHASVSAGQCDILRVKLDHALLAARKAEDRLATLEAERDDNQQGATDDLSDLRKQSAFMKKNIAVLHSELEALRAVSQRRGKIVAVLGVILTLAAALLIMRFASGGCRRTRPVAEGSAPAAAPGAVKAGEGGASELPAGTPAGVISGSSGGGAVPLSDARSSTWPSLQVEGLRTTISGNSLVIRFDEGAFASLTKLTPNAATRLKTLAGQLRPHMTRFRLVVEGHTDDVPMRPTAGFADNQALAAARAEAVAAFLRADGALPATAVTATRTPGAPPYPNDTQQNRIRNRTAVLKLIPR